MTAEDYLEIRLVVFFHVLFFERIFTELVLYLRENRLNLASFFRFLVNDRHNWPTIFADFIHGLENDTRAELIDRQDLKFNFSQEEVNDIRENALDLNTYYMCKLIAARGRVDCFKKYLFTVLQEFILANSVSLDTEELTAILDICFDKIPDYPDLKKRKTIYYPYDLDSWLQEGDGRKLSSFKTRNKIKYLFELDAKAILLFNTQYKNTKNIELNLYRIRKKFIVSQINPSRAYTYQRTQL